MGLEGEQALYSMSVRLIDLCTTLLHEGVSHLIEDLGVALEAARVEDERGHDIRVDVRGRAPVLEVPLYPPTPRLVKDLFLSA